MAHVYAIVHTATGRGCIGSSCRVAGRLRNHRGGLLKGSHGNPYLQAAWTKYGAEAFDFVILDECPPEEVRAVEQAWIELTQAADRRYGFNLSTTTSHATPTPEGKARHAAALSKALTGRKYPPEHGAAISEAKKGKMPQFSPENWQRFQEASRQFHVGSKRSDAWRAAISRGRRAGKRPPPFTVEHREHLAESLSESWGSEKQRAQLDKVHAAKKGVPRTPEVRAKIAATLRARRAM